MAAPGIRLIVGLGNPGAEYEKTRHNVGAWFVEQLTAHANASFKLDTKLFSHLAKVLEPQTHRLMIPTTFMNESGRAVLAVAHYYKILPEQILVAHDEIDFDVGKVRIKQGGGHGGHNGLRDIIACIKSHDFFRLRIGVGHPGSKEQVSPHVLGKPSTSDKEKILDSLTEAARIVPTLINGEFQQAFHKLHSD